MGLDYLYSKIRCLPYVQFPASIPGTSHGLLVPSNSDPRAENQEEALSTAWCNLWGQKEKIQ